MTEQWWIDTKLISHWLGYSFRLNHSLSLSMTAHIERMCLMNQTFHCAKWLFCQRCKSNDCEWKDFLVQYCSTRSWLSENCIMIYFRLYRYTVNSLLRAALLSLSLCNSFIFQVKNALANHTKVHNMQYIIASKDDIRRTRYSNERVT